MKKDMNEMSREELIDEIKRLRLQELDLRAEGRRWIDIVTKPITDELESARELLWLMSTRDAE